MLKPLELHSVRSGPPLEQIISTGLTLKIGPKPFQAPGTT